MASITRQWQIPVSMQIIPGALLFLSMFTLKESVRWLVKKGRSDEAWESLTWIRGDDSQETRDEFDLIGLGVNQEFAVTEGLSKKELFEPANRYRFFLAGMLFLCQQATGATALAYFAPQFFQLLVGSGDRDLLITALFGAVKLVACTFFILFMADRFGRRTLMIGGGLGMATCIFCASLVYKFLPPPGGAVTSAGEATIALIFLNIMIYNCSWGPIPWAYTPEIFSSRMREMGMSFATCIHWLFSFVFSISTPYMIASMGWGTFLFYAIMDVSMALFVFFFVKETRGQSLESMEHIFHSKAGADIDLELKLEIAHVENLGGG